MNILQTITAIAREDPNGDPLELARVIVRKFTKADLIPLIADEIAHEQRAAQRQAEEAAFAPMLEHFTGTAGMLSAKEMSSSVNFKDLYTTPFRMGDGTQTTWGQATLAQHEQRLAMLLALRAGLDRTIERHQEAVRILRTTGVTCLEEVALVAA